MQLGCLFRKSLDTALPSRNGQHIATAINCVNIPTSSTLRASVIFVDVAQLIHVSQDNVQYLRSCARRHTTTVFPLAPRPDVSAPER